MHSTTPAFSSSGWRKAKKVLMVTKVATRFIGATDRDTAQERLLTLGTSAPLLYQCFQTDRRKTPISEVPVFYTWASLLWTLLTYCSA